MPEPDLPSELRELGPVDLSFWLASTFDAPMEQQHLLEMDGATERLERERDVLKSTLDYLRATSALQGAFSASDAGESEGGEGGTDPIPPKGGPD